MSKDFRGADFVLAFIYIHFSALVYLVFFSFTPILSIKF